MYILQICTKQLVVSTLHSRSEVMTLDLPWKYRLFLSSQTKNEKRKINEKRKEKKQNKKTAKTKTRGVLKKDINNGS